MFLHYKWTCGVGQLSHKFHCFRKGLYAHHYMLGLSAISAGVKKKNDIDLSSPALGLVTLMPLFHNFGINYHAQDNYALRLPATCLGVVDL